MPLDPHAKRLLDMLAVAGTPDPSQLTPLAMRQAFLRLARLVDARQAPAGGSLAAVVCQLARRTGEPRLALQLLLCPAMATEVDTESRRTLAEGYFLDRATIEWTSSLYSPPGVNQRDPRLSPLFASDFCG